MTPIALSLPLSSVQARFWIANGVAPESPSHHLHVELSLPPACSTEVVAEALRQLASRHEMLRTVFRVKRGFPVQVVQTNAEPQLRVVDGPGHADNEAVTQAIRHADVRTPFDLAGGPPWRAVLVTQSSPAIQPLAALPVPPQSQCLVLTFHPLIADRPSLHIATSQLQALLAAGLVRQPLSSAPFSSVPALYAHPPEGAEVLAVVLEEGVVSALRATSRQFAVAFSATLFAAFALMLRRTTGESSTAVGVVRDVRAMADRGAVIGPFEEVKTVRLEMSGHLRLHDLMQAATAIEAGGASACSEDATEPTIAFHHLGTDDAPPVGSRAIAYTPLQAPRAELDAMVCEEGAEIRIFFMYRSDVYERSTISEWLARYEQALRIMSQQPRARLDAVSLLLADEHARIVVDRNATARPYPATQSLVSLFEAQVDARPGAIAVEDGGETLTYASLDARSNQVARALRRAGVGTDQPVGVLLERGSKQIVALLGILKAGGAYVALDPSDPWPRIRSCLEQASVSVAIASSYEKDLPQGLAFIDLAAIEREDTGRLRTDIPSEALAYVAFTSGSTGRPKGVAVSHRAVVRLLVGTDYARLGPDETLLQLAPVNFDASTFEIWGALLHGGRLVIHPGRVPLPAELGAWLQGHRVTTAWLTASLFNRVIADAPEALRGLSQLLIGGEALSVPHVHRALALLVDTRIINGYGPTECTTFACCWSVPRDLPASAKSVPLGRPIANTTAYVLDGDGQPVPDGATGELHLGGPGLARGYIHAPAQTAACFIPDAISGEAGARLYRTGDLVRWTMDGTLVFLGRLDAQTKLRGYRIELGEIEAALVGAPGVGTAAAIVAGVGERRRLIAYVVPMSPGALGTEPIRATLEQRLPWYMVPSAVVVVPALPLTASGKVDRRRLLESVELETAMSMKQAGT